MGQRQQPGALGSTPANLCPPHPGLGPGQTDLQLVSWTQLSLCLTVQSQAWGFSRDNMNLGCFSPVLGRMKWGGLRPHLPWDQGGSISITTPNPAWGLSGTLSQMSTVFKAERAGRPAAVSLTEQLSPLSQPP